MTHMHGGNIYSGDYLLDFSANVNPLGIPRAVTEAACEGVRLSTAYPDPDQRELKAAIAADIRAKDGSLVGNMSSEGTTPRQLTDLIASLCDLTSGSGDKGTPVVLVQGYFDNYTN